jgi:V8-like Glu-specific endopeptidase
MERKLLQLGEAEAEWSEDAAVVPRAQGSYNQWQGESFPGSWEGQESLESPFVSSEAETDSLTDSVGQNGVNRPDDVRLVQRLINAHLPIPLAPLVEDGKCEPKTIFAIKTYQQRVLGMDPPDGRVDVGGRTFRALKRESAAGSPEFSGFETTELEQTAPPSSGSYESHFPDGEALTPEQERLDENEVRVVLGRTPNALVLHQFLNSYEMRQAALASLLGNAARRTVRVHGVNIPIPAYLRVVARVCREVAEQSESEAGEIGWRGRGHHCKCGHIQESSESTVAESTESESSETERYESAGAELEQKEFQVAFDPFAPPRNVVAALSRSDWGQALSLAIQAGVRDENELTNLIFFAKHRELPHASLDTKNPKHKQLSAEWLQILNNEVWAAIQAASENTALVVSGSEVADIDRFYWGSSGKRLKQLVAKAAKEVDLNPGLLGTIIMAETRSPQSYLTSGRVSSYLVGTDDFYEGRAAIAARVPAYAKVHWDKTQTPSAHLNDATTPREVKSILFDSGPDALLATAVYIKFREVRLHEIAQSMKGDFDKLPVETRFALTRMAMAAGTAGVTPSLKDALDGKDILVRKAIPVKIYQTKRNATVRTAQAMHLSEWIFGIPVMPIAQAPGNAGTAGSSGPQHESENAAFPGVFPETFSETEMETEGVQENESGKFGAGTRKRVPNTQEVPFCWICAIDATRIITTPTHTERTGLAKAGTGLLISPCRVLTAAHVLHSVEKDERGSVTSEQEAEIVQVTPALDNDNRPPYDRYKVKSWVLHPKWDPKKADPKTDYALITLEKCAGDERFANLKGRPLGYWKVEVPPSSVRAGLIGGEIVTAGYPESKNKEMWCFTGKATTGTAQGDSVVLQKKQGEEWVRKSPTFHLTADAERGQSGSPVWAVRDGQRYLVGVLVDAGPKSNEAVTINEGVIQQLQTWMGQDSAAQEVPETVTEGPFEFEAEHRVYLQTEGPPGAQNEMFEGLQEFEDEAPRGLAVFDHMHIVKTFDAKAPGGFTVGTTPVVMKPSAMNPGFIDDHDEVIVNRSEQSLQTCLDAAITSQFSKFLASKTATKADGHDRVRIALVDLTGPKLSQPEFAGWGSTVAMYGASSAKILALYAAFQLRKDLRQMAEDQAIPTGTELAAFAIKTWKEKKLVRGFPDLKFLFGLEKWSTHPEKIDFTEPVRATFNKILHNGAASLFIRGVGFPYIASVAWQSGLRHPMRGGLWLSAAYDNGDTWADNPSMKAAAFVHNVTALSVVTFFTLLAQGRLVDDASSIEIATILREHGCFSCLFPKGITLDATKCGIFKPFMHDCVLARHMGAKYAAAVLTEIEATWRDRMCPTGGETGDYTNLCQAMDGLLVANQRVPKTACAS